MLNALKFLRLQDYKNPVAHAFIINAGIFKFALSIIRAEIFLCEKLALIRFFFHWLYTGTHAHESIKGYQN